VTAQPSRRAVLLGSAAGVAALGVAAGRDSEAASSTHALPVSHDPVLHAARRLSFGATPELVSSIRAMGVSAWVDQQLSGTPDEPKASCTLLLVSEPSRWNGSPQRWRKASNRHAPLRLARSDGMSLARPCQ